MTRSATPYAQMGSATTFHGLDVTRPVEGFYRFKLVSGGVWGGVEIRYGAPLDPITGEELDRCWRWMAFFEGELVDWDRVWPQCAGDPITEDEYRRYCARAKWAQENAPDSAYADRRKRHDPLARSTPLPF